MSDSRDGIQVIDERPQGYARIGLDFIDDRRITRKPVICTYIALARFAGFKHGATYVRRKTLAKRARIGNLGVLDTALKELCTLGWLRRKEYRHGYPVIYALTMAPCKGYKPYPVAPMGGGV